MLTSLLRRFAPELSIQMTPKSFTITNGATSVSLATYLYVEPADTGYSVLAVGEVPAGSAGQMRMDLFGSLPPGVERAWALEAFLRHAIQQSVSRQTLIRPSITVTGLDTLGPNLREDQVTMLVQALINAGARTVVLPEWNQAR